MWLTHQMWGDRSNGSWQAITNESCGETGLSKKWNICSFTIILLKYLEVVSLIKTNNFFLKYSLENYKSDNCARSSYETAQRCTEKVAGHHPFQAPLHSSPQVAIIKLVCTFSLLTSPTQITCSPC
jgi:hypothetical protein